MCHLYSELKCNQISSANASIEKYQLLIFVFKLTALYLNPVDLKEHRINIFIISPLKKNMALPVL
jgi:hypothetical protein